MRDSFRTLAMGVAAVACVAAASLTARASEPRGSFDRTLQVTGPVSLEVTTGSGDIVVRAGASGTVHIRGKIFVRDGWFDHAGDAVDQLKANPPIRQDGNHISVGPLENSELNRHVSIDYEVEVPADTELRSKSGSGDLTVEGIRGPVTAHSGSGDLKIRSVAGDVNAETGSGDARVEGVSGGRLEIQTGSGDLELRDAHCALHARTGSGDIVAEGDPTGEWMLRAGSGEITLHLPPAKGYDLDVHSSSGDVSTTLPITVQGTLGHGQLHGQVRGGGVHVEADTGSGDIRID